ncbi:MAG TPA: hypothetical protein EYP80_00925 [Candidatus Aenigmarchaeota archaeon]|nr:hypothetical protein [Candidatus Aenigmarchaeota archaeon]
MKAQVSVEMLIIIGIGVAIISIYILYSYNFFYSYKINTDTTITREALEKIVKNAEFVFRQGEPARQEINICLPASIKNCSINNKTLSCSFQDNTQVFYDSKVNLNGSLPQTPGCWDLILISKDNFVEINQS